MDECCFGKISQAWGPWYCWALGNCMQFPYCLGYVGGSCGNNRQSGKSEKDNDNGLCKEKC